MNQRHFCAHAVAYLKPSLPDAEPADIVADEPDAPVMKDLGNNLLVLYVVDQGDHFQFVQNRDLRGAKLSVEELHEVGIENLARIAAEKLTVYDHGGYFAVILDGHFEASLILLDDLWGETFAGLVQGDYAVAIPARDILAFSGIANPEGVAHLKGMIGRLASSPDHPVSDLIYVRRGGEWRPLAA